jgi:TonB family protein
MQNTILKNQYPRRMECAFILSLLILISCFYSFKKFDFTPNLQTYVPGPLDLFAPLVTQQPRNRPRPKLPQIPVPGPDIDILKEVTIAGYIADPFSKIDTLIPPDDPLDEIIPFEIIAEKPRLLYTVRPEYPELARKINAEGTVEVEIVIGKNGMVEDARILRSIPILDEAALTAVKQFRYTPARQRDKTVRVKAKVSIAFKLR